MLIEVSYITNKVMIITQFMIILVGITKLLLRFPVYKPWSKEPACCNQD